MLNGMRLGLHGRLRRCGCDGREGRISGLECERRRGQWRRQWHILRLSFDTSLQGRLQRDNLPLLPAQLALLAAGADDRAFASVQLLERLLVGLVNAPERTLAFLVLAASKLLEARIGRQVVANRALPASDVDWHM